MGKAKSGCVSLVDQEGKLQGIFTDGDLRRYQLRTMIWTRLWGGS